MREKGVPPVALISIDLEDSFGEQVGRDSLMCLISQVFECADRFVLTDCAENVSVEWSHLTEFDSVKCLRKHQKCQLGVV